jgi:hypothetical protein
LLKSIIAFISAVIGGYIFAVLTYSQLNLSRLVDMGVTLSFGDRVTTALHDLLSMGSMYFLIMAVALLVAFLIAGLIVRWVPNLRMLGFVLAGAVGMFAMIMFFKVSMGTNPIAVTRTLVGFASQCLAGALAGFIYVKLSGRSSEQA